MNDEHQNKPPSRRGCLKIPAAILAALASAGSFMEISTGAWAEQTDPTQVYNANSGQITAVGSTDLEVEHRSYPLHLKLEIRTEGGQPLQLRQLQVGMGVRLELKEGAVFKIMVLNPK